MMGHPVYINGVHIDFPYEPYGCQIQYMRKVIACLKEGKNGLLESPTGTGKTVSLLCAALAWQQTYIANMQFKSNAATSASSEFQKGVKETLDMAVGFGDVNSNQSIPKIIYASRTHTQLSQVIKELKRTSYKPRICVLGSRDQMCVNDDVLRLEGTTSKVYACKAKISSRSCMFFNNVEGMKNDKNFTREILDIEDLGKLGKQQGVCPYFMSRELKTNADLILMPYNYVLDFKTRKSHGVDLNNTIVLLDEAHNVEKVCEDASSFDLTSCDLASAQKDCDECHKILTDRLEFREEGEENQNDSNVDLTPEDVVQLKDIFKRIETLIDSVKLDNGSFNESSSFLFKMLKDAKIDASTAGPIVNAIDKCNMLLLGNTTRGVRGKHFALQKLADIFKVLFFRTGEAADLNLETGRYYKVAIQSEKVPVTEQKQPKSWETKNSATKNTFGRTLSYWCFHAGIAMKEIMKQGVRSLILTSGTLSPLNSFAYELDIPFQEQLQNPHVIGPGQIWAGIIGKGPDGAELNSSYDTRFKERYLRSMGNLLVQVAQTTPQGLLVFFPSYYVMKFTLKNWAQYRVIDRIAESKPIFSEPENKRDLAGQMQAFYAALKDPAYNGAVFFAVCRGKVSEGLDFADQNGRVVIITGIPYPPLFDEKIKLKMGFLDESKGNMTQLKGFDWYRQQATRAVNQAVGRVIRHKNDYGAILLCDYRFSKSDVMAELPTWIRKHLKLYNNFDQAKNNLIRFFSNAGNKVGATDRQIEPIPGPSTANGPGRSRASGSASGAQSSKSCYNSAAANSLAVLKANEGPSEKGSIFQHFSNNTRAEEAQNSHQGKAFAASIFKGIISSGLEADVQPKAKRLKIVSRRPAAVEGSAKANPPPARDKVKEYIQSVKSLCNEDEFTTFRLILFDYKENEDIHHLLKNLKLFYGETKKDHIHMIKQHALLIRKKHFDLFKKTCEDLIERVTSNESASTKPQATADFFPELSDSEESDPEKAADATIKPKCIVCLQGAQMPHKAPCKHIACYKCWYSHIKMFKNCPKCKVHLRRRHLKKIHFF
ncbi:regulator of telomere elongation helicase 1-like [Rhopilema esculentum]|uniref:regulator of telomere elongation helicase 1-like n=1 Tax=Rhopilema esculentum TaxID=499914 RepID=UPI0031E1BE6E